ncbi:hypothetical protein, partial [Metabacillus fastidiosus]|uniref:hypothetical protein n=1 Tax=Metabacillus fastidiosus TaxID=1458 RepID=UPI003D26A974
GHKHCDDGHKHCHHCHGGHHHHHGHHDCHGGHHHHHGHHDCHGGHHHHHGHHHCHGGHHHHHRPPHPPASIREFLEENRGRVVQLTIPNELFSPLEGTVLSVEDDYVVLLESTTVRNLVRLNKIETASLVR